nr:phage tail protein [Sphingobium lignivorans]
MGGAEWFIDKPAFLDVAEALYIEEFGLSLKWNQQEPIETFVGEVLDHIQATIFVNPTSGLLSIKLLRGDYDLNDLPQINAGNAKLVKYERKLYGQTANEVVLSWTNPENEQTETISAQDLANVEIQGSPVSTNRDYYMIRSAALAQRILDRDLRTVSAPLASLEIEVDRRGSKLVPGGLARVDFPERKIYDMICRIGRIDYGKPLDSRIKISLIEDIFALDLPEPTTPPRSAWENVQVPPSPVDHSQVITIPAFFANRLAANMQYPEVIGGVLAAKDGMDVIGFDLLSEAVDVTGASQWANQGEKTMLGRAQILTPLYQEAQSLITGIPLTRSLRNPHVGAFVAIGSGGDHAMEFALISAYDEEANAWVLERGILDTVPRSWEVGTPVWFIPIDANIADTKDFKAVGETVSFKLLTRTSLGTLPFDDADEVYGMMSARPHAPLRPANVKINGVGFGKVDATGATELVVSWSNRNRLYEDGQVVRWNEGNVTPEYLQQTIITVFRQNGDLMYYRKGLWTETQFTIPIAWVQSETKIFVRVSSQRKGLASIQSYGLWVENIPQVADPAPPPASDDGPAPPPPPDDPEDPTPDPIDGIEDPPLPDLGGGPGGWN